MERDICLSEGINNMENDLISRQSAIDALWKALYEYQDKTEKQFQESDELDVGDWILHREFVQNMSDIDRRTILDLPSAQPDQQWIPCSERLPKEKDAGILKKLGTNKRSDYVIATVEVKGERMTVTACTYDGAWDWNMKYAFPDFKVVAWMPLPEPYREDGESDG